jgi:arylsulfatase A-like enzyme
MCQIDLVASFVELTHQKLPNQAGPDSVNLLSALLGETNQGRDVLVEQGRALAIRQGDWKLIDARETPRAVPANEAALGSAPPTQLFNLAKDLGESKNIARQHPEKVNELTALLQSIRAGKQNPSDR